MDCNKEEALRAKDIAEKKMENRDFVGARKIALKAQQLYPDLENIAQMLVVCDVHCSAEQKLFGNEMDWYEILQVEQTAGDAMIKKQYRKLALQLHPDKNKFAGAEAAFKLIGEAQRVLLDREKRSLYDMKRRVPMNKPAVSRFNSTVSSNVRPNFTSSNAQQQQQSRQPAQQRQNGGRPTFWTVCPFCAVKYQYYKEILNKSLRCQNCRRPFVAYEVDIRGKSSPATNSTQQASDQQKDGLNHGAFKVGAGSQGNSHAEKSNAGPYDKKGPTKVSGKPNGKRKRKQVAESSESSDSMSSSDSEGDMVSGKGGFFGVENHSTFREGHPRRSTRKKHPVSYKDNVKDNDDGFLKPRGDGENHGETTKMNDQNGLAANLKDEHKEVKQKQHLYSKGSLVNRNEETKMVSGKDAVGGSKQMDETSEHSPDSTSKAANHPNVYVYPDAEFSDFDKDKKKERFAAGQIWAVYDTTDGMPRFYALIRKVLSPRFKLQITWFESHPDSKDEIKWVNEDLPVACGKYKLGDADITEDHLMFSHLVLCEKISRNTFKVYPRKGETWALFKNWDIKWFMDVESHQQHDYEFVEILTDYVEGEGVNVAYLAKLKGFVSLFFRNMKEDNKSFQIPPLELFRFSHRVPSFKMIGEEGVGVPTGSYELDPAALPMNLEEIAVPENLDVKVGHSSSGGENTRSSDRSGPPMTSEGDTSISKVNLERSNLASENKDSVDDSDNCCAPPASSSETIEIPDTQFFNFDAGRSLEKFQIGQIWAFYSDEDGLPKYYGQINKIETRPDLELHVSWLTCSWLPENTIKWEDRDMDVLISCGRFKVNKTDEFLSVYSTTSSVSHQVHADAVVKNKNYTIFPRKGEVWALYRKWTKQIKCSDLKNWEYDIVEVVEETDLFINVLVLEFVSGFSSVFRGKSNGGSSVNLRIPRKELLRFSHQIPAFKLTEEHGNLRDFWELDPGALPIHYYSLR
ncbi:HLJ1 protein [Spatholobus suberectus]|nr:HLJ1 protein [Spatholobus suberectus]